MQSKRYLSSSVLLLLLMVFIFSGCAITIQKGRRSDMEAIETLRGQNEVLNLRLQALQRKKQDEFKELEAAKALLEKRLRKEIDDKQVRLEMAEKGLSIIFLTEILFDSGKADIRQEGLGALEKVARVLEENIPDRNIGIEGHTDNEPIKYSKWKSNWDLSTARALSVLHYLVGQKGIDPKKVSATGYGEYSPVASNETPEGRRENRRVEIIVLPKNIEKIEADIAKITQNQKMIQEKINRYKK